MSLEKSCLIFGATGLVGKKLVEQLIKDQSYSKIKVANRTSQNYDNSKIEESIIDFSELDNWEKLFKVNHVFICLGTTIKNAGSKSAFETVDLEYPRQIAQLAKKQEVEALVHISAIGANAKASNFYLKTKGKAEEAVSLLGPKASYAVRPSMLLGERDEFRLGESVGKLAMKITKPIMVGGLKKYRGVYDYQVASSMIQIAKAKPSKHTFESDELIELANNKTKL